MSSLMTSTLVDSVKRHALDHYNDGGWDVLVEAWTDAEILAHLTTVGAKTEAEAISAFSHLAEVWRERQEDAKNSAF